MLRWKNTLFIPLIATLASGILLITHVIFDSRINSRRNITEEAGSTTTAINEETRSNRVGRKISQHADNHGGPVIFGFKIAQLIGCLTLFFLSLATLLLVTGDSTQELIWDWHRVFLVNNLPQIAMAVTFVRLIIINVQYNLLTRHTVVYLLSSYNFCRSEQLEPIYNAP